MKKSLLTILGLSANLFLIGCADDQARAQIADTNAKLAQLQSTVGNVNNNPQITTLNKLDELQSQIDQINGNVDTLDHNQKNYQATQEQLNQSMEQQIQSIGQATGQKVSSPQVASAAIVEIKAASSPVTSNKNELSSALKKIKSHNFPAAIKELKSIIKTSTNSDTVADAQYYLAISYAANSQYTDAIATARKFVADYPQNRYAPDALRTQYVSQIQLGMKQSAAKCAALLKRDYPDSEANKKVQASIKPVATTPDDGN